MGRPDGRLRPDPVAQPILSPASLRSLKREATALTQMLAKPLQRALPCELGGCVIVTGSGVVVEAVIGALVNESFVRHVRRRGCGIKIRPTRSDARVKLAVTQAERMRRVARPRHGVPQMSAGRLLWPSGLLLLGQDRVKHGLLDIRFQRAGGGIDERIGTTVL